MAFTSRFITIPIKVYDTKHKELTNEEINVDAVEKINPFEISQYRESYDGDFPDKECVCITCKNGKESLAYLSMREFEKLLNTFQSE